MEREVRAPCREGTAGAELIVVEKGGDFFVLKRGWLSFVDGKKCLPLHTRPWKKKGAPWQDRHHHPSLGREKEVMTYI